MIIQEIVELVAFAKNVTSEPRTIQAYIARHIDNDETVPFVFDIIENCVSQKRECKKVLAERLVLPLLELALDRQLKMTVLRHTQLFKTINHLLRSSRFRMESSPKNNARLKEVAELLKTIGDYEAQVIVSEFLIRVVTSADLIDLLFSNDVTLSEMFRLVSKKNFEVDIRNFINHVNKACGEDAKVWTYPCITAEVGGVRVFRPSETNYTDFWVDFNEGNGSLLIFCQFDDTPSGTWNGLTIFEKDVANIKLFTDQRGSTVHLTLNREAYLLFDSATFDQFPGHCVKVTFKLETPLRSLLAKIFPNILTQVLSTASKSTAVVLPSSYKTDPCPNATPTFAEIKNSKNDSGTENLREGPELTHEVILHSTDSLKTNSDLLNLSQKICQSEETEMPSPVLEKSTSCAQKERPKNDSEKLNLSLGKEIQSPYLEATVYSHRESSKDDSNKENLLKRVDDSIVSQSHPKAVTAVYARKTEAPKKGNFRQKVVAKPSPKANTAINKAKKAPGATQRQGNATRKATVDSKPCSVFDLPSTSEDKDSDDEWWEAFEKRQKERQKQREMLKANKGSTWDKLVGKRDATAKDITSTKELPAIETDLGSKANKTNTPKQVKFSKAGVTPGKVTQRAKADKGGATIKTNMRATDDVKQRAPGKINEKAKADKPEPTSKPNRRATDDEVNPKGTSTKVTVVAREHRETPKSHLMKTPPCRSATEMRTNGGKFHCHSNANERGFRPANNESPPASKRIKLDRICQKDSSEVSITPKLQKGKIALHGKSLDFDELPGTNCHDAIKASSTVRIADKDASKMTEMGDGSLPSNMRVTVHKLVDDLRAELLQHLLQFLGKQEEQYQAFRLEQTKRLLLDFSHFLLNLEAKVSECLKDVFAMASREN